MNILLICNKAPFPPKDGGAVAISNLAKGLVANGNKVSVMAMNTQKHFVKANEKDLHTSGIEIHYVTVDTSVHFFSLLKNFIFSNLPYNAERFINSGFLKELKLIVSQNEFDIIQFEGLYVLPYLNEIKSVHKAKTTYRSHNIEHEIWNRLVLGTRNMIKKYYLKTLLKRLEKFERSLLNTYDALIPITERDEAILKSLGNDKPSFVSPTGIVKRFIVLPEFKKNKKLFFLGSLDWMPNQEGLLWFLDNCWNDLSRKYKDLEFHIAGRNAPLSLIQKLHRNNTYFHGEIDSARDFVDAHDIQIVPLFSGSGMRIKIIEAMARGKAVITTDKGAEGIKVNNNQHLLLANNTQEFINSVDNLIENHDFYTKIATNSVNLIKQEYENEILTGKLSDFYQTLIKP